MSKVLVVDDAEFLRMRISRILTTKGYEVLEADSGLTAVSTYRASKPDVVVMDITMPEMDGLTALKEIKAIDPEARVLILTALGQESVAMDSVKAGACDFIVKPFEPERVVSAIERALQRGMLI